jgi:multiple sugar transport system permease protein
VSTILAGRRRPLDQRATAHSPAQRRPPAARRGGRDFRDTPRGWLYAAPAVLIFAAFVIAPTFYTFYISLWKWNSLNPKLSTFLGFANYRRLLTAGDPGFGASLWHSLYFTGGMVLGGTAISLGLALLLQRGGALLNASRVAVYLPHATPLIATSLAWVWILNPQFGLANWALHALHLPTSQWLQSSSAAMPSILVYSLWHEVGFTTVVFLGGLAVISDELGEAARVDGCSPWREFWHVTWPQLRPVTVFVVVITAIGSLKAYTQFFEMSEGGPANATTTLSYLLYEEFYVFNETGYGAAIAVVLFLVTVFFTLVRRRTAVGGGPAAGLV